MYRIALTQGKFATVSRRDYSRLNRFKWCAAYQHGKWYAVRGVRLGGKQRLVRMHRVILGLDGRDKRYIDHRNGNGLDSTRRNLRIATNQQNQCNRGKQHNNSSGYKGVGWHKGTNKWQAYIMVGKKQRSLGLFDSPEEAAKAYNKAARTLHVRFAKLNKV